MRLKKKNIKNGGFTLIELVVVIALLGILVAITIPRFSAFIDKSNKSLCVAESRNVLNALASIYAKEPTTVTESLLVGYTRDSVEVTSLTGELNGSFIVTDAANGAIDFTYSYNGWTTTIIDSSIISTVK